MFYLGETYSQKFKIGLSGESFQNDDGSCRQKIIAKCKQGDAVELRREPDNPYDVYAIAVYRAGGKQLGYVPAGDARLADHIDRGGKVSARIAYINGGPTFFEKIIGRKGKSYGCVIEIEKGSFNWEEVDLFRVLNLEADKLCKRAKKQEQVDSNLSLSLYEEAWKKIEELDQHGRQAIAWRTTRYPINRYSLLLEKTAKLAQSLALIERYISLNDSVGLTSAEEEAISKRKARLQRKLG